MMKTTLVLVPAMYGIRGKWGGELGMRRRYNSLMIFTTNSPSFVARRPSHGSRISFHKTFHSVFRLCETLRGSSSRIYRRMSYAPPMCVCMCDCSRLPFSVFAQQHNYVCTSVAHKKIVQFFFSFRVFCFCFCASFGCLRLWGLECRRVYFKFHILPLFIH